jgi:hypothetical protein
VARRLSYRRDQLRWSWPTLSLVPSAHRGPGFQIASVSKQFAAWIPDYAASIVVFANEETTNPEKLLKQLLTAADKA